MESDTLIRYQSIIYWSLTNLIIFAGLYCPPHLRCILFLQPYLLFALSYASIRNLLATCNPTLVANMGIHAFILSLLWPVYLLQHPKLLPISFKDLNLRAAHRIHANPIMRPDVPAPPGAPSRIRFAINRVVLCGALYLLRRFTHFIIAVPLAKTSAASFSPAHTPLSSITPNDLIVRLCIIAYWLVEGIVVLRVVHYSLSIIRVSILRLDDTHEWQTLFGSPVEAYTIRRFWGRFWHPLFGPAARFWAERALTALGIERHAVRKVVVSGMAFGISGVMHALVAWRLGGRCVDRDIWFFGVNFLAELVEVVVLRDIKGLIKRMGMERRRMRTVERILGYFWVVGFWVGRCRDVCTPRCIMG